VNYRPYPDAERAFHQLKRGSVRACHFVRQRPDGVIVETHVTPEAALSAFHRWWQDSPRRTGKTAITAAIVDQAVKAGEHVHVTTRRGVRCHGGDGDCGLLPLRPAEPLVLARAKRTCTAVPSQWNAWTADGQYLYLRYRSGIGTVDAYDTEDSEQWTRPPDGRVAIFDTGDTYGGDMSLVEFCERAGLQLADDAEVTGE
jgi:hypothetical protein